MTEFLAKENEKKIANYGGCRRNLKILDYW